MPYTSPGYFTTMGGSAETIYAETFDPAVTPWPAGVAADAGSPTGYSLDVGPNMIKPPVTPGDWVFTDLRGIRRVMHPTEFEATYTPVFPEQPQG